MLRRSTSRCRQAQDAQWSSLDHAACADYCVGWENRTVNGLCVTEIGAYIDCWGTITDPCAFPSGPVPASCVAALVSARCCLGLAPYENAQQPG
jgi:hypothetical protein